MKLFFAWLIPLCLWINEDLSKVRACYKVMSASEKNVEQLITTVNTSKSIPLLVKQGYLAAAEMASAKYKFSPLSKLELFNSGKKKLENAIAADSNNLEIRYLRLTIQHNAPSFLGYNKNITSDKLFLTTHLHRLKTDDSELYVLIHTYLVIYYKVSDVELKETKSK